MDGQRIAKKEGGSKLPWIVTGVTVGVLAAAYIGLCAWAGSRQTILPNVTVAGVDVSNMTIDQAQAAVDAALRRAGGSVYRLEVIHGFHSGTQLRDMVRRVYGRHPKVRRLELGLNQGSTTLVLREY